MDNKLYTAVLKYETEGIQLTTRQIKELDDHIAELARTAGTSDAELNRLQKVLDGARASAKGFQTGLSGVSGGLKELITDARAASAELRKVALNNFDPSTSISGSLMGGFQTRDLQACA